MNFDWQTTVTLLIVAAAGAYLLMRIYRVFFQGRSGNCGSGCSKCSDTLGDKKPLVDLKVPEDKHL